MSAATTGAGDPYIYINNELKRLSTATVPLGSASALYGINAFEGIRGYKSLIGNKIYIFRLDDHLDRLRASCAALNIKAELHREIILDNIRALVKVNNFADDIAIRIVVICDSIGSWSNSEAGSVAIMPISKRRIDREKCIPLKACISSWERINGKNQPPRVKCGANYINSRYGHMEAKFNGYDVPIFLNTNGLVAESSGACILAWRNGVLLSTRTTDGRLDSITVNTISRIAESLEIEYKERGLDRMDLYTSDEIMLCGTAVELTPIASIDHISLKGKSDNTLWETMHTKYIEVVTGQNEDFLHWLDEL